jgi:hypothetical protein
VRTTGCEVKSHFYIYLLSQLQHISLLISGVILQNLDWLQLKFDFVSRTATICTEFSSGLKFPPNSNEPHEKESIRKIPIIDLSSI